MHHSISAAYILFAFASAVALVACALVLRDSPEPNPFLGPSCGHAHNTALYLVVVFAFAAFLQVGIENTVAAWLPTYALRMAGSGTRYRRRLHLVLLGWISSPRAVCRPCFCFASNPCMFSASRSPCFRIRVAPGVASSIARPQHRHVSPRRALAPTYPLVLAGFFARSPSHCRLSLDSFHCRLRWFGSSLDRRLHFHPHRQPPHRNAHHSLPHLLLWPFFSPPFANLSQATQRNSPQFFEQKREGEPPRLPFGHTIT